jgi:hypothetical protein
MRLCSKAIRVTLLTVGVSGINIHMKASFHFSGCYLCVRAFNSQTKQIYMYKKARERDTHTHTRKHTHTQTHTHTRTHTHTNTKSRMSHKSYMIHMNYIVFCCFLQIQNVIIFTKKVTHTHTYTHTH